MRKSGCRTWKDLRHDQDPHRGRLALRQRPSSHRPCRRLRRALRRLQPLHADGGSRRADGERHRRARHADPGPGRAGGCVAARAGRPLQPHDRRGPARSRPVLRPVHPHHHPQPLHRCAEAVPHRPRQRLHDRADHHRGGLAVHRAHPARPVHRGHLPDLRVHLGPGRPVRQLRQPARPVRPDRPEEPDQRGDAEVRRDHALLPRPARAGRGARRLAAHP